MVWSVNDAGFWKNLTAARHYMAAHGSLACPRNTVWDGVEIGQWLSNLHRPGGLGTDPVRADERRRALEAIDPEWNPGWPATDSATTPPPASSSVRNRARPLSCPASP